MKFKGSWDFWGGKVSEYQAKNNQKPLRKGREQTVSAGESDGARDRERKSPWMYPLLSHFSLRPISHSECCHTPQPLFCGFRCRGSILPLPRIFGTAVHPALQWKNWISCRNPVRACSMSPCEAPVMFHEPDMLLEMYLTELATFIFSARDK